MLTIDCERTNQATSPIYKVNNEVVDTTNRDDDSNYNSNVLQNKQIARNYVNPIHKINLDALEEFEQYAH